MLLCESSACMTGESWAWERIVRAVTGQVWLLLLLGEAVLSTGRLKLRATCLGSASARLAQSHRNLHPASKESSWLRTVLGAERKAVKPPGVREPWQLPVLPKNNQGTS